MTETRMQVTTTGFDETMRVLKQLDPELRKQTLREIRKPLNSIVREIRGVYAKGSPMSGWRTFDAAVGRSRSGRGWPAWNGLERQVRSRVGRDRSQRRRQEWGIAQITSASPAAQIYEFAGSRGGSGSPQSAQFIRNLDRHGRPGRAVWDRVDANKDGIEASVMSAVKRAEDEVNRRLGRL